MEINWHCLTSINDHALTVQLEKENLQNRIVVKPKRINQTMTKKLSSKLTKLFSPCSNTKCWSVGNLHAVCSNASTRTDKNTNARLLENGIIYGPWGHHGPSTLTIIVLNNFWVVNTTTVSIRPKLVIIKFNNLFRQKYKKIVKNIESIV